MSHNLAIDKKTREYAMLSVGGKKTVWHHLGQGDDLTKAATWEEAYKLAHLDWSVNLADMYSRVDGKTIKIDSHKSVWRENGNSKVQLGVVGANYEPIQNKDAFDFVDALLGAENGAHYETAGALGRGERIWVLARVPGADFHIPGTDDRHEAYLLIATSHNGTLAYTASLTDTRVVCANTLRVALNGINARTALKIKHTLNGKERLEEAKKLMASIPTTAKELQAKMDVLAHRKMTRTNMEAVLERLFPGSIKSGQSTRQNNVTMKILELFESNDGNAIPQVRGTAYNMLNAITEYTDHYRGVRKTDNRSENEDMLRAENAVFGTGEDLKEKALVAVLKETEGAPYHDFKKPIVPAGGDWIKAMGIKID